MPINFTQHTKSTNRMVMECVEIHARNAKLKEITIKYDLNNICHNSREKKLVQIKS